MPSSDSDHRLPPTALERLQHCLIEAAPPQSWRPLKLLYRHQGSPCARKPRQWLPPLRAQKNKTAGGEDSPGGDYLCLEESLSRTQRGASAGHCTVEGRAGRVRHQATWPFPEEGASLDYKTHNRLQDTQQTTRLTTDYRTHNRLQDSQQTVDSTPVDEMRI